MNKNQIVIFDLDNTLLDVGELYDSMPTPKEWSWDKFLAGVEKAHTIEPIHDIYTNYFDSFIDVHILTARPLHFKEQTHAWINRNLNEYPHELIMMPRVYFDMQEKARKTNRISDIHAMYKAEYVKKLLDAGNEVIGFFDDSVRSIEAVNKLGVLTFLVKT